MQDFFHQQYDGKIQTYHNILERLCLYNCFFLLSFSETERSKVYKKKQFFQATTPEVWWYINYQVFCQALPRCFHATVPKHFAKVLSFLRLAPKKNPSGLALCGPAQSFRASTQGPGQILPSFGHFFGRWKLGTKTWGSSGSVCLFCNPPQKNKVSKWFFGVFVCGVLLNWDRSGECFNIFLIYNLPSKWKKCISLVTQPSHHPTIQKKKGPGSPHVVRCAGAPLPSHGTPPDNQKRLPILWPKKVPWSSIYLAGCMIVATRYITSIYFLWPEKKQKPLLTLLQSTMCLGRVSPSPANFEISMIDATLSLYLTARTPLDTARVAMLVISFGQSTNLWKQSGCKYFGPSLKLFAFLERMHTLPANIPARFPTNYLTSRNVWCL